MTCVGPRSFEVGPFLFSACLRLRICDWGLASTPLLPVDHMTEVVKMRKGQPHNVHLPGHVGVCVCGGGDGRVNGDAVETAEGQADADREKNKPEAPHRGCARS